MEGGSFTISNLGMFGLDRFTAIINPPKVAILAVGAAHKEIAPDTSGQPILRTELDLVLGVDHRAVDGATAARFMADLKRAMENPDLVLL